MAEPSSPFPLSDLIYDWNAVKRRVPVAQHGVKLFDETLRDGIQNPSVVDPKIEEKIELVHLMSSLGIDVADVGLPGAGKRAFDDVTTLVREIVEHKLAIKPACAGRTVVSDITPMVEVSQRTGIAIEVMTFIGSSPIRQLAEEWDVALLCKRSADAIDVAVKNDLPCTFVTEDTTRSRPEVLSALFKNAIDHGAKRLCLCDTVGHATPDGVRNLIDFTRAIIAGMGADVGIDWHGHNDRGLALENALWAFEFGADRVHGCALGIGERVGNTPMDLVLLNLKLLGELEDHDLSKLMAYCELASRATRFPIPINYPLVGRDAFRTGTGVHAAAIVKAKAKGADWLADRVYSGVPAGMFGREQEIEIGPMSGLSNVGHWLARRRIEATPALVDAILKHAKGSDHLLSEREVLDIVEAQRESS
ncbi:MAG: 2-isopropylmalate synthase [Deltaproteobacteria bacterium]|nr:2-isopropylmalate synthase [Deltaproteobacteria bacterium]